MTSTFTRILHFLARHGRLVLVAGLIAGIALPGLAKILQAYIPEAAALMLFVMALRIGPREALGRLSEIRASLSAILFFQVVMPVAFALAFKLAGFGGPVADAIIILAAAPPISGSPNLVLLTRNDPAPALRLLITGTALLPVTIFPAFYLWPAFGDAGAVLASSLRLMVLIGGAALLAFTIRAFLLPKPSQKSLKSIDGLSVLVMALVVLGLMADFGPAISERPGDLALTLVAAFGVNFGLQIIIFMTSGAAGLRDNRAAYAISAGNRNMMLFIAALPVALTQPILLFLACYQVPMYLTPLLLGKLYSAEKA